MTLPVERLGLRASQWQFLEHPDAYVAASKRKLVPESTARQFVTARDILERLMGSYGEEPRRGILLADDVGLGKTTVAAIVAWVVASAGEKCGVRILAPNDVMMRRWEEELLAHVEPLSACAPSLDVNKHRVKPYRVGRLSKGSIQVVKHSYAASDFNLTCDLLIVDEAHRAKGETSAFSAALKRQKKYAQRVLILTATPFSIRLEELQRMLTLIGGDSARGPVRKFSRALDDLYAGNATRGTKSVAERLAAKAVSAVEALRTCVIRHGVDDLKDEQEAFGGRQDWAIDVPPASAHEIELLLRMDRSLRVADFGRLEPRFHVGWKNLDAARHELAAKSTLLPAADRAIVESHLKHIRSLRAAVGVHSKIAAVAAAVKATVGQGEKVLVFCHHHATAQELTSHLATMLPVEVPRGPDAATWRRIWGGLLDGPVAEHRHSDQLRETFLAWLCSDLVRGQIWSWLGEAPSSPARLQEAIHARRVRHNQGRETIADEANALYHALLRSRSTRGVLKAAQDDPERLPSTRVLGVCPDGDERDASIFIQNQQPDTVIAVFNSPFGPDVLVATDKLSEGVDLHRYCRHLVHYELDPSPIRTLQRNGRLRRVNSWASVTRKPILYAFPAFRGTRDHRLVQIMKKRVDSFSLLLGGVQDFDVDEVVGSEESWRNEVISLAREELQKAGRGLCARKR